jgi:apolipoprotein N-acyltransferase
LPDEQLLSAAKNHKLTVIDFPRPSIMLKYILSLMAGSLLTLAFAPFNLPALAILSLLLFLKLVDSAGNTSAAVKTGFAFGLGFYTTSFYWVYITLFYYGHFHYLLASSLTILLSMTLSSFTAVNALLLTKLNSGRGNLKYLIIFPGTWTLLEWVRSWILSGFPWQLLSQASLDTPLEFYLPIVGSFGTGFIICLITGCIYCLLQNPPNKLRYLFISIILFSPGIMFKDINWTTIEDEPIKVTGIQFNIEPDDKMYFFRSDTFHDEIIEDTFSQEPGSIVVWPESAIMEPYQNIPNYISNLIKLSKEKDISLISGVTSNADNIYRNQFRIYYNSMMIIEDGSLQLYGKHKLVPMGDYIPFGTEINKLFFNYSLPMSNFRPDKPNQAPVFVKNRPFLPIICFEVIFGEIVRREIVTKNSQFIINVSEDGWFRKTAEPAQHLQIAQVRALENGRYLIRVTNRGHSALIDSHGKIITQSKLFVKDIIKGEIFPVSGATPYMLIGSAPILSIIFLLIVITTRRKKSAI